MIDTRTFLRIPFDFEGKCKVYVPCIEEVFGNERYGAYKNLLCMSQEDVQDAFLEQKKEVDRYPTPLEFLLENCRSNKSVESLTIEAFQFFIHETVSFLYDVKAIVIGELSKVIKDIKSVRELKLITNDNYLNFQNTIRLALGESIVELSDPNEDPRITRMKAKARYRDRIKAKKGVAGGISFQTSLEALCCMGIGLTPLNIGQLSIAAVGPLISRYQLKDKYETDIKSLLAGAKASKIHPVYWIKDD